MKVILPDGISLFIFPSYSQMTTLYDRTAVGPVALPLLLPGAMVRGDLPACLDPMPVRQGSMHCWARLSLQYHCESI